MRTKWEFASRSLTRTYGRYLSGRWRVLRVLVQQETAPGRPLTELVEPVRESLCYTNTRLLRDQCSSLTVWRIILAFRYRIAMSSFSPSTARFDEFGSEQASPRACFPYDPLSLSLSPTSSHLPSSHHRDTFIFFFKKNIQLQPSKVWKITPD